jgi:hypothetical protein
MKLHANAALSLRQRHRMAMRPPEAAEVRERTCSKWVARYRSEGELGLLDPSSAPETMANGRASDRSDRSPAAVAL